MNSFKGPRLVLISLAALALASCDQTENSSPVPEAVGDISVSNPRLILAPVAGRPAAGYFEISNHGDSSAIITGVSIEGAENAMLHGYDEADGMIQMAHRSEIEIPAGSSVALEPGGLHIMAMVPSPELAPGETTSITLTFATGDPITLQAKIRAPGDER